jgi:hypothetical protein
MWRHGFAVADMNRDGRPDLVFTSPRKEPGPPVIFLNEGGLHFARWEQATFPNLTFDYGAVAAGDFDGNGTMDLAVGVHYVGVIVLLHDGHGGFVASSDGYPYPSTFSSRAVTVTDWNHDGRLDVVALSDGPRPGSSVQLGVTVFQNLGTSWTTTRSATSDAIHGDAIVTGDVDADGLQDIVTATANAGDHRVLRIGADGALARREIATLSVPYVVQAVDLADFDRNGRDEIVVGYSTIAPVMSFIDVVSFPAGSRATRQMWSDANAVVAAVATGDVDGDDELDVVAALSDGRILTFSGDGQGSFARAGNASPYAWRPACVPYAVRVADLDGDRRAEIIVAFAGEGGCPTGGGIEILRAETGQARRRSAGH